MVLLLGATFVTGGASFVGRRSGRGRAASTRSAAQLVWTDCGEGAECAHLEVPLDYAHPNRATIELAVLRVVARDPSVRIGSLVVNPGGPGAAGAGVARAVAAAAPSEIRDRFDIVGFDPRGTGESSPVRCGAATGAFLALDFSPTSKSERAALLAGARAYSRACKKLNGQLLEHVSTLETARDLDLLRGALGDDKLTYLGISYGTYLGALYADRFPSHVGRWCSMVRSIHPCRSPTWWSSSRWDSNATCNTSWTTAPPRGRARTPKVEILDVHMTISALASSTNRSPSRTAV